MPLCLMVNAAHVVEPVSFFYLFILFFSLNVANALFHNMTMILALLFKTARISYNQLCSILSLFSE